MRIVVISQVVHYRSGGRLYAYGPFVRELELWAEIFDEVVMAAPCRDEAPTPDCSPFFATNIRVKPQVEAGGDRKRDKLYLALRFPQMLVGLVRAMWSADAIHVRCPGNLGLLGALLAPAFSRLLVAKYAGQWGDRPGEPLTITLQKRILKSFWWRGPVTVYDPQPGDPEHIVPFFNTSLSIDHLSRADWSRRNSDAVSPLRVIFTGRLSTNKNVQYLLKALKICRDRGSELPATIVGDGPFGPELRRLCRELGLERNVTFTGALPFEALLNQLEQADIMVLASDSEGCGKSLAEGMAFGLICIGSDRGGLPELLAEGRGVVIPPRDEVALADRLMEIIERPEQYRNAAAVAARYAQRYTVEGLRDALRTLLIQRWSLSSLRAGDNAKQLETDSVSR